MHSATYIPPLSHFLGKYKTSKNIMVSMAFDYFAAKDITYLDLEE